MLKLSDNLITEELNIKSYQVITNDIQATIYYEKETTEEEKELVLKQIKELESSIKRRQNLLNNENYVNNCK